METTENLVAVETDEVEYPSLPERFQSTFIDTFFILVMMVVFSQLLEQLNNPPDWLRVTLFITIWFLYEPLCTAFGCTIGNSMKGIVYPFSLSIPMMRKGLRMIWFRGVWWLRSRTNYTIFNYLKEYYL